MLRRRTRALAAAAVLTVGLLAPATAGASGSGGAAVVAGGDYLALGDSVSFGWRERATLPAPDYARPSSFVGFPEIVGRDLGLTVANLACPGETSSSLINPKSPSYGCENNVVNGKVVPVKVREPLHARYRGSQLSAGVAYLKSHRRTTLVTLMVGADDYFLCAAATKDRCASETRKTLAVVAHNTATILRALRSTGYRGQIVLVGYYSLDYANPLDNTVSGALDAVMQRAARRFDAEYANGFAAWRAASRYSGGDPCRAGLLTELYARGQPTGTCGVHPSPAGQAVLAEALESTVIK